eukprot:scaffold707_cov399-Prasinococcus_capsulatus_cf.AAC.24
MYRYIDARRAAPGARSRAPARARRPDPRIWPPTGPGEGPFRPYSTRLSGPRPGRRGKGRTRRGAASSGSSVDGKAVGNGAIVRAGCGVRSPGACHNVAGAAWVCTCE